MTVCKHCHLELPAAATSRICDDCTTPAPEPQPEPTPRRAVPVYSETLRVNQDRAFTRHANGEQP